MRATKGSERSYRIEGGQTVPRPAVRRLRGYAFDPSLSTSLSTALVNEVVFRVPWEDAVGPAGLDGVSGPDDDITAPGTLDRGPIGEYLEVIDVDPASGCHYDPVDLNDPLVLAQDGLEPSEGNPQFHQQMVYAVAMTTIQNFEGALGRPTMWAGRRVDGQPDGFVRRLRIYPHALRNANAYYSPSRKALLFGYFPAPERGTSSPGAESHFPGGWVFSCLSHDIVAHETTHALLDGMHRRYLEPTHPDTLAFHEAFADLVALFQHFTFPEVLRHQIGRTRGDLSSQNLLGELAQQFGNAIGQHGALRSAIGRTVRHRDGDRVVETWQKHEPDPNDILTTYEPHARGAILVAAVFDAFLAAYEARTADLIRIATSGSGVLPEGELHPDLVNRLADEAATTAQHVLRMCIRALDYCPPVDITFGDFLRAIVTADSDLVPSDDWNYRVAFIEAFRRRGIYPRSIRTLSVDSLRWPPAMRDWESTRIEHLASLMKQLLGSLRDYATTRKVYFENAQEIATTLKQELRGKLSDDVEEAMGGAVRLTFGADLGIPLDGAGHTSFDVASVRPAERVGPDGNRVNHAVVVLTQSRPVELVEGDPATEFDFRAGCTLIFDLDTYQLKYAIGKSISDEKRLARQREFMRTGAIRDLRSTYLARPFENADEPFAFLHMPTSSDQPDGRTVGATT